MSMRRSYAYGRRGAARRQFGLHLLCSAWLGLGVVAALLIISCANSTDPGVGGVPNALFLPAVDSLSLGLSEQYLFSVQVNNAPGATITYYRGDSIQANARTFLYEASHVGLDSLRAAVVLPDSTAEKQWMIRVTLGGGEVTPPVRSLVVDHDLTPSSLVLTWNLPAEAITPRPLARFFIGLSYTELSSEADWENGTMLDTVAVIPGAVGYQRRYGAGEYPALQPGAEVWLAIRAEDEAGVVSALGNVQRIRITSPYWLDGFVRDDAGLPLGGKIVSYGCDICKVYTQPDGSFRLGPFRDIDRYILTVTDDGFGTAGIGDYYDFVSDTVSVWSPQPLSLYLITAWGLDDGCGSAHGGDFLDYLRYMTQTNRDLNDRPGRILLKWEEYPLQVYVQEALNVDETFSLDALADTALAWWNDRLGEDYFVKVPTPEEADLEVLFMGMPPHNPGKTDVVEPPSALNVVIPIRVHVRISHRLTNEERALEVILHELGHALCLGGHSQCPSTAHLMNAGPIGIIQARLPLSPINDDEVRAARAVRVLPQGIHMDHYSHE